MKLITASKEMLRRFAEEKNAELHWEDGKLIAIDFNHSPDSPDMPYRFRITKKEAYNHELTIMHHEVAKKVERWIVEGKTTLPCGRKEPWQKIFKEDEQQVAQQFHDGEPGSELNFVIGYEYPEGKFMRASTAHEVNSFPGCASATVSF